MLSTLRAVCRRFRTVADRRLAKHVLLVGVPANHPCEDESACVFALAPPAPGVGARRGPLLGRIETLQSGHLSRALDGGTVDLAGFGACPELRYDAGTIRLRSSGPFDSASLTLCGSSATTVVQFIVVTPTNDPFVDIPLLPHEVGKLVFHISFDSSVYLANAARSVPFESYLRRRVVFVLSDRAIDSVPPTPPQLLSPCCSLLTSLASGLLWYAIAGARVTVVGLDAVNPGWLGADVMRPHGRVSVKAIRNWLKRVDLDEPSNPKQRAQAWANVDFVSHAEYRAALGDEEYALETVE